MQTHHHADRALAVYYRELVDDILVFPVCKLQQLLVLPVLLCQLRLYLRLWLYQLLYAQYST